MGGVVVETAGDCARSPTPAERCPAALHRLWGQGRSSRSSSSGSQKIDDR